MGLLKGKEIPYMFILIFWKCCCAPTSKFIIIHINLYTFCPLDPNQVSGTAAPSGNTTSRVWGSWRTTTERECHVQGCSKSLSSVESDVPSNLCTVLPYHKQKNQSFFYLAPANTFCESTFNWTSINTYWLCTNYSAKQILLFQKVNILAIPVQASNNIMSKLNLYHFSYWKFISQHFYQSGEMTFRIRVKVNLPQKFLPKF